VFALLALNGVRRHDAVLRLRMPVTRALCSSRSTRPGWIIGGSGGSGVLDFRGRRYPLSTGGLDYGLVFGGSKTILRGRVSNIFRPSDVAGVYGAAGAGLASVARARDRADQPERARCWN